VNQGLKYQIEERSGDSFEDMQKQSLCLLISPLLCALYSSFF